MEEIMKSIVNHYSVEVKWTHQYWWQDHRLGQIPIYCIILKKHIGLCCNNVKILDKMGRVKRMKKWKVKKIKS